MAVVISLRRIRATSKPSSSGSIKSSTTRSGLRRRAASRPRGHHPRFQPCTRLSSGCRQESRARTVRPLRPGFAQACVIQSSLQEIISRWKHGVTGNSVVERCSVQRGSAQKTHQARKASRRLEPAGRRMSLLGLPILCRQPAFILILRHGRGSRLVLFGQIGHEHIGGQDHGCDGGGIFERAAHQPSPGR